MSIVLNLYKWDAKLLKASDTPGVLATSLRSGAGMTRKKPRLWSTRVNYKPLKLSVFLSSIGNPLCDD